MIFLKIKPLSVNKAWQGKRFKTRDYKDYENELLYTLPSFALPKPPYKIYFEFGISKLTDWDNPIKPFQDILQKKYGFDDKDVYEAYIKKTITKKNEEFIRFDVQSLNEKDLS